MLTLIVLATIYPLIGYYVAFLSLLFPSLFLPDSINQKLNKIQSTKIKILTVVSLLIFTWPLSLLHFTRLLLAK